MRQESRRDDRLARSQILVNLQRRVRPARPRRHQHVGREKIGGNLGRRPLAGEDDRVVDAGRPRQLPRAVHLRRLAAGKQQPRVRTRGSDDGHRRKQEIQSLICLERARIQDHRRRRRQAEAAPDLRGMLAGRLVLGGTRRVLDEHRAHLRVDAADRLLERRTDHDDDARSPDHHAFDGLKHAAYEARSAEREIGELLRQAGVHVVEMRHPKQRRERDPDEAAFFVGMDRVVPLGQRAPQNGERQERVERNLRERRPDLHRSHERRPQAAKHTESGHRHVGAERVRDEIDLMPELDEGADAVELAERRAARLEKRLGRNHQNAHGGVIFSRNRSTVARSPIRA